MQKFAFGFTKARCKLGVIYLQTILLTIPIIKSLKLAFLAKDIWLNAKHLQIRQKIFLWLCTQTISVQIIFMQSLFKKEPQNTSLALSRISWQLQKHPRLIRKYYMH